MVSHAFSSVRAEYHQFELADDDTESPEDFSASNGLTDARRHPEPYTSVCLWTRSGSYGAGQAMMRYAS